jgi:hypothetical protein
VQLALICFCSASSTNRVKTQMEHSKFVIGLEFWCGEKRWRCTDVGTRVITAICLEPREMVRSEPDPKEHVPTPPNAPKRLRKIIINQHGEKMQGSQVLIAIALVMLVCAICPGPSFVMVARNSVSASSSGQYLK